MPRSNAHFPLCTAVLAVSLMSTLSPAISWAGDWPQILGPNRDGKAENEVLHDDWPDRGPTKLWEFKVGSGFAGPAVVNSRVVVFHRYGDSERVEAIDAARGNRVWSTDFPARYRGGVNSDTGPRCVPVIEDGKVIVFGAAGDLHCLALTDGKKLWSRRLYDEYDGDEGYFGAGATPLVTDGKILVNVGGRKNAGLAAFSLATGKTLWTATDEAASYSSPTLANIGGKPHAIFVTRMNTVSVSPEDGQVYFRFPFGARGHTVNAAAPLVFGNRLFVSASYGVGCRLLQIGEEKPTEVWSSDRVMSSQYTTCVYHKGYLYGTDGREDYANGKLRCLDAANGKIRWSDESFGVAHAILADEKLLLLDVEGKLILAEANPQTFRPLAKAHVSSDTTRALPALSNGRFYVRTNRGNSGQVICLEVGVVK